MIRSKLRAVRVKKANIGEHYRGFILLTCVCSVFVTSVCMCLCACTSSMCEIFARKVGKDEGMMDRERQRIRYMCVQAYSNEEKNPERKHVPHFCSSSRIRILLTHL